MNILLFRHNTMVTVTVSKTMVNIGDLQIETPSNWIVVAQVFPHQNDPALTYLALNQFKSHTYVIRTGELCAELEA